MTQTQPTRSAGSIVEAVPSAFEEDDPLLGFGLLAPIESRVGSIVARDAQVCQRGILQGSIVILVGVLSCRMHDHVFALDQVVAVGVVAPALAAAAAV